MGRVIGRDRRRDRRQSMGDLTEFARLFKSLVDPYRPELHYMRGPGPKWRAKQAAQHAVVTAEPPALPGLARLQG